MSKTGKAKKAYCIWIDKTWIPLMEERFRQEGVPEPRPGRVGGVVEWIRRLIARELELEVAGADPHEEQRLLQTGQPNPNHPLHQNRPFGRAAARQKRMKEEPS